MQIAGINILQVIEVAVAAAITYLIARVVTRILVEVFERTPFPENIENGIIKISKYVVYIIGAFCMVSILGVDLTNIIVGIGAFSIALSFAVSNIIHNLVSGILVLAEREFTVGDEIRVQAYEGKVVKVSVRTTIIKTSDGDTVYIPNSIFATNPVLRKRNPDRKE